MVWKLFLHKVLMKQVRVKTQPKHIRANTQNRYICTRLYTNYTRSDTQHACNDIHLCLTAGSRPHAMHTTTRNSAHAIIPAEAQPPGTACTHARDNIHLHARAVLARSDTAISSNTRAYILRSLIDHGQYDDVPSSALSLSLSVSLGFSFTPLCR